ncbi:hypothetical protein [Cellulophaga sp. HaHa_2_1]|uniref:hypothetical protein n=1 Tax=Cellulophaga sp. HaHa_2_1 TaxID=2749994 RepID=UPI001C4ED61F|nr:hypothetical protein [Cellulophaga sp. HaHa_2_1]QXP52859.1 hypothetical protein H0I24_02735 [Cellulophaga sp. HaHa_2_1]
MTFAITKYIYPLESSILLSESLNYTIDNPRTEEEIELVKNFITKSLDESDEETSSMAGIGFRLALSLGDLKKGLELKDKEGYALQYYKTNEEKLFVDILAETWLILRFSDEEEFTKIAKNREELFRTIARNDNSEYAIKFNELANYCHVLSILIHNDDSRYHGESFLLSDNAYDVFFKSKNRKIKESVENFIHSNFSFNEPKRYEEWLYWFDAKDWIFEDAERLESLIIQDKIQEKGKKIRLSQKQTPKQKIFHIGGLQKTAYEHLKDPELMLLLLVSIIEYLVTRNPDNNKFNVEDSISKQFKLKCAVLIHNQDDEYDMVQLSNDLNSLYSQRSDIAHGNYKEDFNIDRIVESVRLLNKFIEHILNEYIDDRNLLEYLKDN